MASVDLQTWIASEHSSVLARFEQSVVSVLRHGRPLLTTWRVPLGLADVPVVVGLGETEQPDLTAALDLAHLSPF